MGFYIGRINLLSEYEDKLNNKNDIHYEYNKKHIPDLVKKYIENNLTKKDVSIFLLNNSIKLMTDEEKEERIVYLKNVFKKEDSDIIDVLNKVAKELESTEFLI
jgi:hypothetical protein